MNLNPKQIVAAFVVCLAGIAMALGQAPAANEPKLAEEAFKNVRVLRGISSDEFMETMSVFSASLGANCSYCHVEESGGDWAKYADDSVPQKAVARRMIGMVASMNKSYFGGRRLLTYYSCHRGGERPKVIPNLDELYGTPLLETTDEFIEQHTAAMSADQILSTYIQAIGGADALAGITSYVGKGTYQGYDTPKVPYELYAKAPNQRATVQHTPNGGNMTTYDGRLAWVAGPATDKPVILTRLAGSDLESAKVDADLGFPGRIRDAFTEWKVGFSTIIDDRDVVVLQGRGGGHVPTRFYFDKKSGLLARLVRYTDTQVGLSPTRFDFSDYRDVDGAKMPYRWKITWLGGRAVVEMNEIQVNVPIDAARFAKPAGG